MSSTVRTIVLTTDPGIGSIAWEGPATAGHSPRPRRPTSWRRSSSRSGGFAPPWSRWRSAGPRVQLALGRLQLQEQRVNTMVRRLEEVKASLVQAQKQLDEMTDRVAGLERASREASDPEERRQAELMSQGAETGGDASHERRPAAPGRRGDAQPGHLGRTGSLGRDQSPPGGARALARPRSLISRIKGTDGSPRDAGQRISTGRGLRGSRRSPRDADSADHADHHGTRIPRITPSPRDADSADHAITTGRGFRGSRRSPRDADSAGSTTRSRTTGRGFRGSRSITHGHADSADRRRSPRDADSADHADHHGTRIPRITRRVPFADSEQPHATGCAHERVAGAEWGVLGPIRSA